MEAKGLGKSCSIWQFVPRAIFIFCSFMPKSSRATTTKTSTGKRSPYFKSSSNNKESPLPSNVPEDNAVPDNIDHDLRVLFVGINPGVMSAARGHHFAGPTNHFWPCLSESGITNIFLSLYLSLSSCIGKKSSNMCC